MKSSLQYLEGRDAQRVSAATRRELNRVPEEIKGQQRLTDVELVVGANLVEHGLKVLHGWRLERVRSSAAVEHPAEAASDERTLTLESSSVMTVDIVVW